MRHGGYPLKVVSLQDLILLKSLRSSGQDKDDIEYLRNLENED
jgi:predicted nucleotidyltransferase